MRPLPRVPHVAAPACSCGHESIPPATDQAQSRLLSGENISVVKGGRMVLSNIDIALHEREIVTIIGPNGAGKTTLVRALLGHETPATGRVARRAGLTVGYVPQRFHVDATIPLTVARFLTLGLKATRSDGLEALAQVGASRVVSSQVAHLSGGELQRVILARALLRNPDLLVLDEPARGVDHLGEAELYDLISNLRDARGFGVLLVSHDLHIVMAKADRVVCINGHVCCSGHPHTVAQHPEYARLFGPQAAQSFGVYTHHHDHTHDQTTPVSPM